VRQNTHVDSQWSGLTAAGGTPTDGARSSGRMDTPASPVISLASGIPRLRVTPSPFRPSHASSASNGVEFGLRWVAPVVLTDGVPWSRRCVRREEGRCYVASMPPPIPKWQPRRCDCWRFCVAREVSVQQATRGVGVYHTTHIEA
jgi:hypothetical protein